MYGSVPRNESNCVIEGRPTALNFIIYNPRDNFTNLTVKWFRSDNMARATSSNEELTHNQSEYYVLSQDNASNSSLTIGNNYCPTGPLYRDAFILSINNFSSDKNGYYWCQMYVNNSVSQPSQYAWFYAADSSSCTQQHHFKIASEQQEQCADFYSDTNQVSATTPQETVMITSTSATSHYLFYIIGFLVVLILLAISLFTLILLLLYCKGRKKDCQKSGKYATITILAAIIQSSN